MPRFVSPGGMGGNAIEKFFMDRFQEDLQRQQMALQQKSQGEAIRQRDEELKRRTAEDQVQAQIRQQAQADLEKQRAFQRAGVIAQNALPGDVVSEQDATQLRDAGFGSQMKQGQPTQGADLGVDEQGVNQYGVIPGVISMRGGQNFLNSEAQRAAVTATANANRASAEERARESNDTRTQIAGIGAATAAAAQAGQADSRAIRDQIAQDNNRRAQEAADAKKATADKAALEASTAKSTTRQKVRDLANGLIADPALDSITGAIEGRRDTFLQGKNVDALSRLNQLISSLSVEERGKLKGQGAISNYEAETLAKAVSAINRAAGPEIVRKHLKEVADAFGGDTPSEAASAPAKPSAADLIKKYGG